MAFKTTNRSSITDSTLSLKARLATVESLANDNCEREMVSNQGLIYRALH